MTNREKLADAIARAYIRGGMPEPEARLAAEGYLANPRDLAQLGLMMLFLAEYMNGRDLRDRQS